MNLRRILCLQLSQTIRGNRFHVPVELTIYRLVDRLFRSNTDLDGDLLEVAARAIRRPLAEIRVPHQDDLLVWDVRSDHVGASSDPPSRRRRDVLVRHAYRHDKCEGHGENIKK